MNNYNYFSSFWSEIYPLDDHESFYLDKFMSVNDEADLFQSVLVKL